jgi:glucose-1-phosphate adenylyltransferase
MDYQKMLKHHIDNKAEISLAANYIDPIEASRFGILEVDDLDHVIGFEEKPTEPKTNLASMGVYIFSVDVLDELLKKASDDDIDFGKNIIPKAINSDKVVSVYKFDGYWRDVGTIKSLYQANMDLLNDSNFLSLNVSRDLPVYSKSLNLNPHVILEKGRVIKSVIADGCLINGDVIHSTIAYSSIIESGTKIINSVILPRVTIGYDCFLQNVIVNKDIVLPDNYRCETEDLILITESNMLEVGGIYE